jgi:LysR family transcriptional regulator, glycine cleavage system transcriptional activator
MKRLPPLNALRAFQVVAQLGSFSKAGHALHVTQGAVSRQVKLLEDSLGQALFLRVHQGIRLTESGAQLAAELQKAFDLMGAAVERIRSDQSRQQLAINLPPTFATRWLAPRLSDFCERNPTVDLKITTHSVDGPKDTSGLDCLVIFGREPWPRSEHELLMMEHHILVGHSKFWRNDVPPTLTGMTLLHVLDGQERLPVWERWISSHQMGHLDPKPGLEFSTLDQAINAALNGAGAAIVDETMVRSELQEGLLRRFNRLSLDGPYGYWFIDVASDEQRSPTLELFRQWLVEQARADRTLGEHPG